MKLALVQPNIVLLVLDTARRSNAYDEHVMPELSSIRSDESTSTYTKATTSAPWTLPSHASLFSGQLTSTHGTHAAAKRFDPNVSPLAERLRTEGYETRAYSNNLWVNPMFGFGRGFDYFGKCWLLINGGVNLTAIAKEYESPTAQFNALLNELTLSTAPKSFLNALYTKFLRKRYDKGGAVTAWKINRWLKRRKQSSPFFLFANLLEPHQPYDPPKKYAEKHLAGGTSVEEARNVTQDAWNYIAGQLELSEEEIAALRGLYDGELSYVDRLVGQIYDTLAETGQLEETIFVVCGDHGENIGDHGLMDHQYSVHDTLLNVPLVVRYPQRIRNRYDGIENGETAGENSRFVELRDLYATFLDAATEEERHPESVLENPNLTKGQSTHSLLRTTERNHVVGEYRTPQPSIDAMEERTGVREPIEKFDRALRSITTEDWKFVERTDGSESLYERDENVDESMDRRTSEPSIADSLRTRLESKYGPILPPGEDRQGSEGTVENVPGDVEDRLAELGYI